MHAPSSSEIEINAASGLVAAKRRTEAIGDGGAHERGSECVYIGLDLECELKDG